jgi:putative phage-type endonuclease
MDAVVAEWLKDPPYTHLNSRLKPLIMLLTLLAPVGYSRAKRFVMAAFETAMKGELGRIWLRDRAVRRTIRIYGMNDQRTSAWHAKRGEMITASEVSGIFTGGETRRSLIIRKLQPPQPSGGPGCAPMIWGTRFEPIAKAMYEEETACRIVDVSCVQHQVHTFLGASPDGIIFPNDPTDVRRRGRLVEFKCPFSRAESNGIPDSYVHQMQMQMECTGIDECEYVEFRFKQIFSSEWIRSTATKGVFAVLEDESVNYKPPEMDLSTWQMSITASGAEGAQFIFWILSSTKKVFVPKDPKWLSDHLPDLKAAWDEVLLHRAAGTLPPPPPSKVVILDI